MAHRRRDWTAELARPTVRLRRISGLLRHEIRDRIPLDPRRRLRAWRLGFTAKSYVLYGLDDRDPAEYLPDLVDTEYFFDNPLADSMNDKLLFARALQAFGVRHARVLGYLHRGVLHLPDAGGMRRRDLADALTDLASSCDHLVLKPAKGGSGSGINFLTSTDGGWLLNGEPETIERIAGLLAGLEHYLVSEFVRQADYAARLFPGTPNTLRVLTLWDVDKDEPFLAAAAQRMGTAATVPIDNFHAGRGGLSANIDLETGILGAALTLTPASRRVSTDRHPDSGAAITGTAIPDWPSTVEQIVRVAGYFPEAPLVGWDIVPTDRGPVWLEANVPPGTAVWQVHRPLLRDPRARRFYESIGWISGSRLSAISPRP
jgi:hypothetical protein